MALLLAACTSYRAIRACPLEFDEAEQAALTGRLQAVGSTEELLTAVEEVEACGKLDIMSAYVTEHATDDVRLRVAIMLVQTVGRGSTSLSPIKLMAFKAQSLSDADQDAMIRWAAGKFAARPEAEALLALDPAPLPNNSEAIIAATAPAHIPAGRWAPPGGQPIPMYIGNSVHKAIGAYYAAAHRGENILLNDRPIASILKELLRIGVGPTRNATVLATGSLALRPDITNLTMLEIYEIKPAGAAPAASARLAVYIAAFAAAGVTVRPGRSGAPGTMGVVPVPAGHAVFDSPMPGVITYRYRRGAYVRARSLAPSPTPSYAQRKRRLIQEYVAQQPGMWESLEQATGLTGKALVLYVVVSVGTRLLFPPRNLIPSPV